MRNKWKEQDDVLVYKLWKSNDYSYKYSKKELLELLEKYKIKYRSYNALKVRLFHYHYIHNNLKSKWIIPKQCYKVYNSFNKD